MKALKAQLEKKKSQIIEKVEKRDAVSLVRSEEWHQTNKGKKYEEKTGKLADAVEGLTEAIKNIEVYLD